MKKLVFSIFFLLFASVAFAADPLTYKITDVKIDGVNINITVEVTYGAIKQTIERPVFCPKDKAKVMEAAENIAREVKTKADVESNNNLIKPEVDKEKDKIIPVPVVIEL